MWKFSLKCGNMLGNMEICLEIWKYAWKYGNMLGNQNIVWFSWKSFHYLSQVTTCRRPDHYCFSEPHFAAPTIYSISMDVVFPTRPPPISSQKYIFDTNATNVQNLIMISDPGACSNIVGRPKSRSLLSIFIFSLLG